MKPKNIVVIVCKARSGSTWLMHLLGSHSKCIVGGEMLSPDMYSDMSPHEAYIRKIQNIESMYMPEYEKVKIKEQDTYVISYHFADKDTSIDAYFQKEGAKIIFLRRNPIDIMLSGMLVQQSLKKVNFEMRSQHFRLPYKYDTLSIPPKAIAGFIGTYEAQVKRTLERFKGFNLLEVNYEDLIGRQEYEEARILNFMGLRLESLTSFVKKQRKKNKRYTLTNYKDILAFLQGTRYLRYLFEGV